MELLYKRNECVSVYLVYVLVEMWPPSRSLVTSRKLIDVVSIFEGKFMLLFCVLMSLIKLCKRSNPWDQNIKYQYICNKREVCMNS